MPRTLGERLRDRWLAEGLSPRPGASPEALAAFEARNRVRLPRDFREYLSVVNGTGREAEMDASLHCWWSVNEMISVAHEWPGKDACADAATCFLFADHLIWAPVYAIRLNDDGTGTEIVAIWSGMDQLDVHPVATSFSHLMERYFRDELLH